MPTPGLEIIERPDWWLSLTLLLVLGIVWDRAARARAPHESGRFGMSLLLPLAIGICGALACWTGTLSMFADGSVDVPMTVRALRESSWPLFLGLVISSFLSLTYLLVNSVPDEFDDEEAG